jgi:chromosome partitioning protein
MFYELKANRRARRIIALAQRKGGVGKTTSAVNLAACIAELFGIRCLLIDLDSQGNTSIHLGIKQWTSRRTGWPLRIVKPEDPTPSPAYRLIATHAQVVDVAYVTPFGFDLIPSGADLASAEVLMNRVATGRMVLREKLEDLRADQWPVVLLDCPPSLGDLTRSALIAADTVLCPMPMEELSYAGLVELFETIEDLRKYDNRDLAVGAIFETKSDPRTTHAATVRDSVEQLLANALPFAPASALLDVSLRIRRDVRAPEAVTGERPLLAYDPSSRASEDYRNLAQELFSRGMFA